MYMYVISIPGMFLEETEVMQDNARKKRHKCMCVSGLLKILERKDGVS